MSRRLLITIHLYLSAFFAPMIIVMAVSGGLYLLGQKGQFSEKSVASFAGQYIDPAGDSAEAEVRSLLAEAGIDADFEYLKIRGVNMDTRPTSRRYHHIRQHNGDIEILEMTPSLQASLMELHKGHGPGLYKDLEKIFALGMVLIILSGLYLGVTSKMLRNKTLVLTGAGAIIFVVAAYLI